MNKYERRVAGADWDAVAAEVDDLGCALLPQLLTPAEAARIAGMYHDVERFRATIDMARYRFGEGQYRYFDRPFPDEVEALRQALYPRLLPIARDWHAKLGREAEWPGEAKISGRAMAAGPITEGPDGDRFQADIAEVVHTHLNAEATMLVVEWWTPGHGLRRTERE